MKSIRTLAFAVIMALGASAWAGTVTGEEAANRGFAGPDPVAGAWAPAASPTESYMLPPAPREIGMQTVPVRPVNQTNAGAVAAREFGSSGAAAANLPPRPQTQPLIVPLPSAASAGFLMLVLFGFVLALRRLRAAIRVRGN